MSTIKIMCLFIFLILFSSSAYPQYPANSNNQVNFANPFGYNSSYNIPMNTTRLGDAAVIAANGSFLLDSSEANINNQIATSMYYDNRIKRTVTFFENRQYNSYYRDLEDWQRDTRRHLKAKGLYDREAIEYIYGIKR